MRVISIVTLATTAYAGTEQIIAAVGLSDRATAQAEQSATLAGIIGGYGCWCVFGADHLTYGMKGPPVDVYDHACRNLHWGYECAMLDAEAAGETCVPWEVDYVAVNADPGTVVTDCANANGGNASCEYRSCVIEGFFSSQLIDLITDSATNGGPAIDNDHKHSSGNFDRDAECKGFADLATTHEIECCGVEPFRRPYKPNGGERKCCYGTPYLDALFQCCDAPTFAPALTCI